MSQRILIVDDDEKIQELLSEYLTRYNFEVDSIYSGETLSQQVNQQSYDLVVLDIMMPKVDGIQALKELRISSNIPVIMLTARGDDMDRIIGLELGADDYLSKPFNPRELVARITAVLRRNQSDEPKKISSSHRIEAGTLSLETTTQKLHFKDSEVELSYTEYKLLEKLMKKPGLIYSRDDLLQYARGRENEIFDRSIDMHISKLRSKINSLTGSKLYIKTCWGSGYTFEVIND